MGDRTPSGTAHKIKPLSRPPSVQDRRHNASVHQSDIRRLDAQRVIKAEVSGSDITNSAAAAGMSSRRGEPEVSSKRTGPRTPPPMKTGGLIKRTGVYTLHKGEVVVPAHRVKTVDMALKKDKKVPLKK